MKIIEDIKKCTGCYACFNKCPVSAISMQKDGEGFLYPEIDNCKCIKCGLCQKICPCNNPAGVSENSAVFAGYRNDREKRIKSASGGVFAAIAEYVLSHNGVVFGAAFDENWVLRHICADNEKDLQKLLGSKYVQSIIGNTFSQAEAYLRNGTIVLYSGTPCQIQGLKKYLGKEYENLITIDFFCHGVPSPGVWSEYLDCLCSGKTLVKFTQKDKTAKIHNALVFEFSDNSKLTEKYEENLFMKGFNANLYLRPSCFSCSFKGIERCSDITLGDFWDAEKRHQDFVDEFGASAVVIHSSKGHDILDKIRDSLTVAETDFDEIIGENVCFVSSVKLDDKREKFYKIKDKIGLFPAIRKLTRKRAGEKAVNAYHNLRHLLWCIKNKFARK